MEQSRGEICLLTPLSVISFVLMGWETGKQERILVKNFPQVHNSPCHAAGPN